MKEWLKKIGLATIVLGAIGGAILWSNVDSSASSGVAWMQRGLAIGAFLGTLLPGLTLMGLAEVLERLDVIEWTAGRAAEQAKDVHLGLEKLGKELKRTAASQM